MSQPQSKTNRSKPPAGTGQGRDVPNRQHSQRPFVTIQILEPSGREFCRFDLGSDIFAKVKAVAQAEGITFAQLIDNAVEKKISSVAAGCAASVSDTELMEALEKREEWRISLLRRGIVEFDMNGLWSGSEWKDRQLLDYVAEVVDQRADYIAEHLLKRMRTLYGVTCLMESMKIMRELADWGPHYAKHGSAGVDLPREYPRHLPLPGLLSQRPFEVGAVLWMICDLIHEHWEIIAEMAKQDLAADDTIGTIELCDLLLIAEPVVARGGKQTELEAVEEGLAETTAIQRFCFELRAAALLGNRARFVQPGILGNVPIDAEAPAPERRAA